MHANIDVAVVVLSIPGADLRGEWCEGCSLTNLQDLLKSFKAINLTQKYMKKYLLKQPTYVNFRLIAGGRRGGVL